MILAIDNKGTQITAENAVRGKEYYCPVCNSRLTLKRGRVKAPHFSHLHIIDCMRYLYKRESVEHLELKHVLYLALTPDHHTAMEFYLHEIEQIADLLVNKNRALEIQLSQISPELIVRRTKGYASLGIDAIWLLDTATIKHDSNYMYPTHFQLSTQSGHKIYSIDLKSHSITVWHIGNHMGCSRFNYKKEQLTAEELITGGQSPTPITNKKLSRPELKNIIAREKSQRTVQNLTLTFLYHTGLTVETLPEYLTYSTPNDHYLMNSPLEWKLFIHYHLERGTFSKTLFKEMLKRRIMFNCPDADTLSNRLIEDYIMLYNSQ